jgi:hypothetical protein
LFIHADPSPGSVENDPMGFDLDHLDHDPMVDPMVEVMTPWG